jgi:hypothetical protein
VRSPQVDPPLEVIKIARRVKLCSNISKLYYIHTKVNKRLPYNNYFTFTPNVKTVIIALNNIANKSSHIDLMTPEPASAAG